MRPLRIFEDEWRLLVDLVEGFRVEQYDVEDLALEGLLRMRLVHETPQAFVVTELGRRVRAAEPPYIPGAPRVWSDREDSGVGAR